MVLRTSRAATRAAFTLMEMMVVVAILVVLAGVGGVIYMRYLDDAKFDTARAQVKILSNAVESFKLRHNGEPPQSLDVLAAPDEEGNKPYIELDALKTPWGGIYQYDPTGPNNNGYKADIWAVGPNNQLIGNWPRHGN